MSTHTKAVYRTPYPHIVKVDGVCGAQAIIEGTRIAVWHIVGYYYKVGMSVEEMLAEWASLLGAGKLGEGFRVPSDPHISR